MDKRRKGGGSRNEVIRVTNFFLLGILGGGLGAWAVTQFLRTGPAFEDDRAAVEIQMEEAPLRRDFTSGSPGDADGDGMSDSWELSYQLNPADADDAASDFDRDGLTALQEFQIGSNPLGQWKEELLALDNEVLRMGNVSYVKFTNSGFLLMRGSSANTAVDPYTRALLWHRDTGPIEVAKPGPGHLYARDVNDYGEVVGGFVPAGGGSQVPFFWSLAEGYRQLTPPQEMTGFSLGWGINNAGEILLQAGNSSPVVSAVISPAGQTMTLLENNLTQPRFISLNNYGEVLGVFSHPADGLPAAFLRYPGLPDFATSLDASYPDLGGGAVEAAIFTSEMNDFGEFGCDFSPQGYGSAPSQFYFFDGDYHSYRKPGDGNLNLLDLNNAPQVLYRALVGGQYDYRFASGGQSASL